MSRNAQSGDEVEAVGVCFAYKIALHLQGCELLEGKFSE